MWQKVTFINTSRLRWKWHRFKGTFWRTFWFWSSVCFLSSRVGGKARAKRGCFSFTRRERCFGGSSNWVKAPLVLPQADFPWPVIALLRSTMSSIIEGQINSNEFDLEIKGFKEFLIANPTPYSLHFFLARRRCSLSPWACLIQLDVFLAKRQCPPAIAAVRCWWRLSFRHRWCLVDSQWGLVSLCERSRFQD